MHLFIDLVACSTRLGYYSNLDIIKLNKKIMPKFKLDFAFLLSSLLFNAIYFLKICSYESLYKHNYFRYFCFLIF